MNDRIALELCHVQLASVANAIHRIVIGTPNTIDVAQEYRNGSVHPQEQWLVGMQ